MKTLVVGGGLTGLVAAYQLKRLVPNDEVLLIEKGTRVGGLLAGAHLETYFDLGTHIFQECGQADLDAFLQNAIGSDLLMYSDGTGDLAGSVFAGQLQENSHFIDLRNVAESSTVINDLRQRIEQMEAIPAMNRFAFLKDCASGRFGSCISNSIILPILEHVYAIPREELAGFAMLLPGLTRLIADSEAQWMKNHLSEAYRAVMGYPDQRALPEIYRHNRRSFYSKVDGSSRLISGVEKELRALGVQIETSSTIKELDIQKRSVSILHRTRGETSFNFDRVVFSNGAIGAALTLNQSLKRFEFERPMPHRLLHLKMRSASKSELCYAYGLDVDHDWYRITNYRAFSGDQNDRRLTVEILGDRGISDSDLPSVILNQLETVGLIASQKYDFCHVQTLAYGFPKPSHHNLNQMISLADELLDTNPDWMLFTGVGTGGGLFFQNEVVPDAFERVATWV